MASSSGTYNFNPSIAQVTIQAFHMCGIRPTALLQEHMESARMAANLVLGGWANKGVNLWKVESVTVPFYQGVSTYSVSPSIVTILDLYISVPTNVATTNRYILPVSRTEFASYPNPTQQAPPTVYWHNRTLSPDVNFYPSPDGDQVSFTYYAVQQIQDAALTNDQVADIPYLWLSAFVKGLAAELAVMWSPERATALFALAQQAWADAAATNVETASLYIAPTLSSYWRD